MTGGLQCSMPEWDHAQYDADQDLAWEQYLHLLDEHADDDE